MVTLAEVAQHAGVSASTVSYVLSGKRSISTTTRLRVEQSIRELGYHPNAGARALASSRSNIIALMVPLPGGRGDGPLATEDIAHRARRDSGVLGDLGEGDHPALQAV